MGTGGPVTRRPTCSIGRLPGALSACAWRSDPRNSSVLLAKCKYGPALESLAARATSSIEVSLNPQRVKTPVAISTSLARRGDGSGTVSLACLITAILDEVSRSVKCAQIVYLPTALSARSLRAPRTDAARARGGSADRPRGRAHGSRASRTDQLPLSVAARIARQRDADCSRWGSRNSTVSASKLRGRHSARRIAAVS